jgi:hypothetical protein
MWRLNVKYEQGKSIVDTFSWRFYKARVITMGSLSGHYPGSVLVMLSDLWSDLVDNLPFDLMSNLSD